MRQTTNKIFGAIFKMIGVKRLHVIFDASGSFYESGKFHMLRYLGNTALNLAFMSWAKAEFVFHSWNEELCELENDDAKIPTKGTADTEILRQFLVERTDDEAVILITDGHFEGADKRKFKDAVTALGNRFAIVAAGYDAATVRLQSLSKNFFFAEDMCTAFKVLAAEVDKS